MDQPARHVLGITLFGIVVLFANLGGPRLWDRDEPRNAGCAVEMRARGDWVTPVFNGELRTHKPILLYWFMLSAYAVFGVTEFAARFWSAAFGIGTALLTYGIGRRLFSARVGLLAAIILLTTIMFDVAARAATPDSLLIFWTVAALYVYVRGTFPGSATAMSGVEAQAPERLFPAWQWAVLMYAMMGVAVLAKGPLGCVLPTAIIGSYLLVRQGWRSIAPHRFLQTCWLMRPITAVAVILLVALPWYLAVGARTDGEWLRGFFLEHNLGRAVHSLEGHRGPFFYYPLALLVGFFPWSVFAVPVSLDLVSHLRRPAPERAGFGLTLCWVGVTIGLFSLARTKLPSYITPCYPGVALLVAVSIHRWASGLASVPKFWFRTALAVLGTVGGVILIGVPILAHRVLPGEQWLALIGLVPLGTAGSIAYLHFRNRPRHMPAVFAAGAALLVVSLFGIAAQRVDRHRTFDRLLACVDRQDGSPKRIGAYGAPEPSWIFYAGQPFATLTSTATDAANVRCHAEAPGRVPVRKRAFTVGDFLRQSHSHYVITSSAQLQELKDREQIPQGVRPLATASAFLKNKQLVLLGWQRPVAPAVASKAVVPRR